MDAELRRLARRASEDENPETLAALGRAFLRSQAHNPEPFRIRIRVIGSNQTELETRSHRILFSYETPVAFCVKATARWFRSKGKPDGSRWSRTTVKHINQWVPAEDKPEMVPQDELETLLDT